MITLDKLPFDLVRYCIIPYLSVNDQRSLLDTNREWYKYKKSTWYVTINNHKIMDNLDMLPTLVDDVSKQIKLCLSESYINVTINT